MTILTFLFHDSPFGIAMVAGFCLWLMFEGFVSWEKRLRKKRQVLQKFQSRKIERERENFPRLHAA